MSIERIAEAIPVASPANEAGERDEARAGDPSRIVPRAGGERDVALGGSTSQPPTPKDAEAYREQLEQIQEAGYLRELKLQYEVSDGGELIVTILDARTDEVIRTLPPEEQREFGRRLQETLGLLFDGQA